jgi:hypothetical protein
VLLHPQRTDTGILGAASHGGDHLGGIVTSGDRSDLRQHQPKAHEVAVCPVMDLALVADRLAVSDVVIRYATGVDMRNWELYATCFTDPCEFDFSSWSGTAAATMTREAWVAAVRGTLSGFDATQHISSNHVITFHDEDRREATCVSYMQAQHYLADQPVTTCTLGGQYTNTLTRQPDGSWCIRRCELTVTWTTGDRGLFALARERART